jgi:DNA-binding FrmR family transcriptional regulator
MRLLWLAIEWGWRRLQRFTGSLRVLKDMMDERRGRETVATQAANIAAKYAQLSAAHQAILTAELSRILAERDQ